MKKNYYKKYTKKEMLDIGRNKGFYFVETSNDDYFEIAKDDLVDFIILEAERCGHHVDMKVYVPLIDEPILTTYGWFLNTAKPKLREEIIERLVRLQTWQERPRKVKIFDNDIFMKMTGFDFGEEVGKTVIYDKFFKQYYGEENEMEAE